MNVNVIMNEILQSKKIMLFIFRFQIKKNILVSPSCTDHLISINNNYCQAAFPRTHFLSFTTHLSHKHFLYIPVVSGIRTQGWPPPHYFLKIIPILSSFHPLPPLRIHLAATPVPPPPTPHPRPPASDSSWPTTRRRWVMNQSLRA